MLGNLCTVAFGLASMAAFIFGGPALGIAGALWLGVGAAFSGFLGGIVGGLIGGAVGMLFGEDAFAHLGIALGCVSFALDTTIDDIETERQKTPVPTIKVSQRLIQSDPVDFSTIPSVKQPFLKEAQKVEFESIEEMIEAKRSPYSVANNDNNNTKRDFKKAVPHKDKVITQKNMTTPQIIKNSDTANSDKSDVPQNLVIPLSRATP